MDHPGWSARRLRIALHARTGANSGHEKGPEVFRPARGIHTFLEGYVARLSLPRSHELISGSPSHMKRLRELVNAHVWLLLQRFLRSFGERILRVAAPLA